MVAIWPRSRKSAAAVFAGWRHLHTSMLSRVDSAEQFVFHGTLQGAVTVAMHLNVFIKVAVVGLLFKTGCIQKMVVDSIFLCSAWGASGCRNDAFKFSDASSKRSQTVVFPLPAGPETMSKRPVRWVAFITVIVLIS